MIQRDLRPDAMILCSTNEIMRYHELFDKCKDIIDAFDEAPKHMLLTRKLNESFIDIKIALLKV